ncbi:MAG: hypothetical protein ACI9ND_000123 [Yoonia sp.]|jgi:hypothetical protein
MRSALPPASQAINNSAILKFCTPESRLYDFNFMARFVVDKNCRDKLPLSCGVKFLGFMWPDDSNPGFFKVDCNQFTTSVPIKIK